MAQQRVIDPNDVVGPAPQSRTIDPGDVVGANTSANAPAPPHAEQPGFFQRLQNNFDTNTATSPTESLLQTGLKRVVGSIASPIIHPLDTLRSVGHMANPYDPNNPILQRAVEAKQDYRQGGLPYAATKLAGDALGMYLGGEAGEAGINAVRNIPAVARGGLSILADTGKGAAKDLVDTTATDNATAQAAADAANAKATTLRAKELQTHFDRTKAVNDANDAASAQQSRKAALQRGVETLDPLHKADLQNLEGTVRAEANRRYNDLNATLDPETAPPEALSAMLESAAEKIKGSNTETPIMKDMEKRLATQDPLTYRDLQGYRSEIGRELQKGSLPPDIYHAYRDMMGDITDHMSHIAKSRGLGDQFDQARSYYKQMSDTFDDPRSPIRRALNSTEPGGVVKAFKGKDKSGIEALAQYDPDLAQRINTTRGYAAEAQGIRASNAAPKQPPTLSPKPPPVQPDITQIGPEAIQQAKADALTDRAASIRKTGPMGHLASGFAAFDIGRSLLQGNVGHALLDVGARLGVSGVQHAAATFIEYPAVVNFLTKPSVEDLAELQRLPPEQRTAAAQSLQPLINAATKRGLKIAPQISAVFASGATLPANHPLAKSQPGVNQ
jgi:hypothetical protein